MSTPHPFFYHPGKKRIGSGGFRRTRKKKKKSVSTTRGNYFFRGKGGCRAKPSVFASRNLGLECLRENRRLDFLEEKEAGGNVPLSANEKPGRFRSKKMR